MVLGFRQHMWSRVTTATGVPLAAPWSTRGACVRVLFVPTARVLLMATLPMQVLNTCTALADGLGCMVPNWLLPEVIQWDTSGHVMPIFRPLVEGVAG